MKCLKNFTIIVLITALFCQFFLINVLSKGGKVFAASDSFNVDLDVEAEAAPAVCDNDGICEAGETSANCPNDCGCNNDGVCQSARGEDVGNCPVDCEEEGGGGGDLPDTEPPTIYAVYATNITLTSAVIIWKTTEQARCAISFGETIDYEIAVIAGADLLLDHSADFTELLPDTLYNFKIACEDNIPNKSETRNYRFRTVSPPDITPPANVSNFQAIPGDSIAHLSWDNPQDNDFANVLIVRDTTFYPNHPWEGETIYLGSQTQVDDLDVENNITYYYTAFSYDEAGNYSSGAIASATPREPGAEPVEPEPPVEEPTEPPPPEVDEIELDDFGFYQEDKPVKIIDGITIKIEEDQKLSADIDYEKVPEVLKTIMVSLEKDNKYFSFLLKINEDKTKYTATLAPMEPGTYPMTVYVLDYKNQALKTIKGMLEIEAAAGYLAPSVGISADVLRVILIILLLAIVADVIALYYIKRREQKCEE